VRALFLATGFLFLGVGAVGLVIPGLPTTIFVILAAWCFARSNPELERRLLEHPRLGPPLISWRKDRSISVPHKILAITMIALSVIAFSVFTALAVWVKWVLALCCGGVAFYIATRKTRPPHAPCPLRPEPHKQPEH
jgi:uncharacterized membrane protein YbaN (DUF454 family)